MNEAPNKPPSIETLRRAHHLQALLLGQGREIPEIAAICGSTPERIERLLPAPAFQELIAYYRDGGVYKPSKNP
jgi:hypothetical protein